MTSLALPYFPCHDIQLESIVHNKQQGEKAVVGVLA